MHCPTTYSVCIRSRGLFSGPGLSSEQAERDARLAGVIVDPLEVWVVEDWRPSPAEVTYRDAYLDALQRLGGVSGDPCVMRRRATEARREARAAVVAQHGAEALDVHGRPRGLQ